VVSSAPALQGKERGHRLVGAGRSEDSSIPLRPVRSRVATREERSAAMTPTVGAAGKGRTCAIARLSSSICMSTFADSSSAMRCGKIRRIYRKG